MSAYCPFNADADPLSFYLFPADNALIAFQIRLFWIEDRCADATKTALARSTICASKSDRGEPPGRDSFCGPCTPGRVPAAGSRQSVVRPLAFKTKAFAEVQSAQRQGRNSAKAAKFLQISIRDGMLVRGNGQRFLGRFCQIVDYSLVAD